MKILFTTCIPSPYRIDFFNELGKLCELTVLFERTSADDRHPSWVGEDFTSFQAVFLKGMNVGKDSAFCPEVEKWLAPDTYDFIVIGGYSTPTAIYAIQLLKSRKIPFILNADGGIANFSEPSIQRKVKEFFIRSASWWISSGQKTQEYLVYYGADPQRCYTYPFASLWERELFHSPASQEEKDILKSELGLTCRKLVLTVGAFIDRKGNEHILDVWEQIEEPGTFLIMIGGGPNKQSYEEIIAAKGLQNVCMIDFTDRETLRKYYRTADMFVLMTNYDIWGLVIAEAMAAGLPVISTKRCVAASELIRDDENGWILSPSNGQAFVKRVREVLHDCDLQKKLQKNSINAVQTYTIENMARQHMDIFEEMKRD